MPAKVFHKDRIPPPIQPFVLWWEAHGTFDLTCPPGGGNRNDAMQLLDWAKGRRFNPATSLWEIKDPVHHIGVVTYAQFAKDSAHGHGGGCDLHPVRTYFPNGMPETVYLGSPDEGPIAYAEALRLMRIVGMAAKGQGYESGIDFPRPDYPHIQVPHWRDLPLFIG